MNITEHLLTCLAEECGEVAKECSKALRFGLDDHVTMDPTGPRGTTGPTNAEKIEAELIDLLAVYEMLAHRGAIPWPGIQFVSERTIDAVRKKQAKVQSYMEYAKGVGSLNV